MAKLSILFSVIFTVWFLLLDQRIIIQTTGFVVNPPTEDINEDFLVVDATTSFENSTDILSEVENSTDILSEIEKSDSSANDDDDDVIELNVSGQKISTFRSTLTAVPNSKLALMFTKDNTSIGQSEDKQGAMFFDYNPVQFNYLLDQLRMIKRSPEIPAYELDIRAPNADIRMNFSYMTSDLGLNPDQFLMPLAGTHLNLSINSLIGWKECHRSTYDTPFNLLALIKTCKSKRLLVGCLSADDKENLALAGVGKWQDVFRECSSIINCPAALKDGISFYYVRGQAWGFEGRPKDPNTNYNGYNNYHYGTPNLNACDASDQYSEYRICWSFRSNFGRGGGDRCGSMKNLHNEADWERVIYQAV